MTKPRYLTISWEQFHSDARALASKLINRKDLKKIICVTRGGLFPAAVLARELEIRWIDTICVVGYDEESRGSHASLLKVPETDGEGVLVVDDLVDSGRTGRIIRELMPKAYFVTMYAKPKGQEVVDDFVISVDQDTWILFPWEAELSPASPLVRRQED
ncbi:MAG: xanthine phosphoribosyltransferase [Alphaproteobacteria bacterium]|mgnify:FL=1|nr:xanthine phosphoribosyltransferase [Alphaproteobacteria bacterium]